MSGLQMDPRNSDFTLKDAIFPLFWVWFCLVLSNWSASYALLYLGTAIYGLGSPKSAFVGMLVTCSLNVINPAFRSEGSTTIIVIGRWLIFVPALWHLWRTRGYSLVSKNYLFAFSIIAISLTIIANSYAPIISFAKLFAFAIGVWSTIRLAEMTNPMLLHKITFQCLAACTLSSISVIPFRTIAYGRNDKGFQGIFSHPQTFGVFAAISLIFFLHCYLKFRWKPCLYLLLPTFILLIMSESRTSIISCVAAIVSQFYLAGRNRPAMPKGLLPLVLSLASLSLGIFGFFQEPISLRLESYFRKRSRESTFSEAFVDSRSLLVEREMLNFVHNPIFGIGFGLPSSRKEYKLASKKSAGAPALSTEKGVLYSAVLEETGVVGALGFVMLLIWIWSPMRGQAGTTSRAMVLTFWMINFGECIFFSFGAIGYLGWLTTAVVRAPMTQKIVSFR